MAVLQEKLPQHLLPHGLAGRIIAWLMPLGHSSIYKAVSEVANLQPQDDLVEIACGSGGFIKKYASNVRSVAGIDLSELMVKLATNKNRKRIEAGTAEFKHGEASQLPWEDNKFSVAIIMSSFFVFPKPQESLKEIYRVLRPGGRAIVSIEWNAEDGVDHTKEVKQFGMWVLTEAEVRSMMQEAGFSNISIVYKKGLGTPKIMLACGTKQ